MKHEDTELLENLETSELTLASLGAQAPLVVDLPDGQKLVVGILSPGTVIEIATWRGTGRPDSRANRFMLGVSASDEYADGYDQNPKALIAQKSVPQIRSIETQEVSINKWVENDFSQPTKSKGRKMIKFIKFIFTILVIALITAGLVGPGKIRIAHPNSGISTFFSSAENSLVIVRETSSYEIMDNVITNINDPALSPFFGQVIETNDKNLLVGIPGGQFQVVNSNIHGKALLVIPFLGILAQLIGR
jgi:hypothetical protein